MSGALTEYNYPDLVRKHLLAGKISPGRCTVSNHDDKEDWHVQQGTGSTGATSTLWGKPIVQFDVTYELGDVDDETTGISDIEYWDNTFAPLIQSTVNQAKPKALPFFHPDVPATEVCKATIGGKSRQANGGVTVKVTYIVHRPPKPKKVAKATFTNSGSAAKPDPNAAAKAQLAALVEEAKKP